MFISELDCNKENIKEIKAYFAKYSVCKEFKEADHFIREILSGSFTEEHISKYLFLVIMKNSIQHNYTLLGKAQNPDQSDVRIFKTYPWQILNIHPNKERYRNIFILPTANQANIIYKHVFQLISSLL